MIPILDSLAHPTITGKWLERDVDASFGALGDALTDGSYAGACAIGMAGVEGYAHDAFLAQCKRYPTLIPVAGIDPTKSVDIAGELRTVRELGYRAIKIHPRFTRLTRKLDRLRDVFLAAEKTGLTVFYCTYLHGPLDAYPEIDPLRSLVSLLQEAPGARVVLVHGGDVELLRYAELVRFNPNLLLDLSLTMMKYEGSSVDLDIRFLFNRFDRRICVGSDFPEYSHRDLRRRFDQIAEGVAREKLENIAFRNLRDFIS